MSGNADPSNLFQFLEAKHPAYMKNVGLWELYRDICEEDWDTGLKEVYLIKGIIEPASEYKKRAQMSEFLGESPIAVGRITSSLFMDMPARTGFENAGSLKAFMDASTRTGDCIDILMQEITRTGLVYGTCHVLVDRRQTPENIILRSKKDEMDAGIHIPFAVSFTPLDLWNWDVDADGNYNWVNFAQNLSSQKSVFGNRRMFRRFTVFNRENWSVFEINLEDEQGMLNPDPKSFRVVHSNVPHNLGYVPVISFSPLKRLQTAIGMSFINKSSRADLKGFRRDSDLQWDLYVHSHPILKVWTNDSLKKIGVGGSVYMQLKPKEGEIGAEEALYVSLPDSAFEGNFRAVTEARGEAYRHAGLDPMGIANQEAPQAASGLSRAWSFSTSEAKLLSSIANKLEQFEFDLLQVVADYTGDKLAGTIRYPQTFDLAGATELIKSYKEIGPSIKSDIFHGATLQRIAINLVGDITAEKSAKMLKDIEKAGKPEMIVPLTAQQQQNEPGTSTERVNKSKQQRDLEEAGKA